MKATTAKEVKKFQDIPNVGRAMEADFVLLGIKTPKDLAGKDSYVLYNNLCKRTHTRQDPCVLDTYMAVIAFMNGAEAQKWWNYTEIRKGKYPNI